MRADPIDASVMMGPEARAEFDREWRITCSCPRLEIVEVNGGMRCGACRAPILKRRRVA